MGQLAIVMFSVQAFRYLAYAGCTMQILAACVPLAKVRADWLRLLLYILLGYLAILAVYGYLEGNWVSFLFTDLLAFGLLAAFAVGPHRQVVERLSRLYQLLLIPGLLVSAYMLIGFRPASEDVRIDTEMEGPYRIASLLFPAVFVLLPGKNVSRVGMSAALGSLAMSVLFGLLTASRGVVLMSLLVVVSYVWTTPKRFHVSRLVFIHVGLAAVFALSAWSSAGISQAATTFDARMRTEDFSTGRNTEEDVFWDETSDRQAIIGRGLGGAYSGLFGEEQLHGFNMVHYGHLHLILKGGVVLLGLFGLLLGASIVRLGRSPDHRLKAAAAFGLYFALSNFGHQQFFPDPPLALLGPAVGVALAARRKTVRVRPAPVKATARA